MPWVAVTLRLPKEVKGVGLATGPVMRKLDAVDEPVYRPMTPDELAEYRARGRETFDPPIAGPYVDHGDDFEILFPNLYGGKA